MTKDELGGSDIHARAGAVDDVVASEAEAFARARRFLSYLPASVYELPERIAPTDDAERRDPWLIEAVPAERRKVYDMRRILNAIVDKDSLFEMGRKFGGSVITALARLDGWPVAVLASDPYFYGGGWTADASQKVARFVDLANTFHLPVVHLVDVPGFVIGIEAEKAGTIRQGARALAAIYQAKVPWCSVIIRKVFGVAGAGHTPHHRLHYRYAWPSGDWGSLPVEGGIEAAYRAELDACAGPRQAARRNRGAAQPLSLAVPHRRDIPCRGDHRPARYASVAVRVRESHCEAARTRTRRNADAAVKDISAAT